MAERMKTTQVRLDTETAKKLREIAAQFGFYTSRGIDAGKIGNIAAMLEAVARGDFEIKSSKND
jgi:hypothetical protein